MIFFIRADLVPKNVLTAWLKHLREELPTVPFKASTQQQSQNLGRRSAAHVDSMGSDCVGKRFVVVDAMCCHQCR